MNRAARFFAFFFCAVFCALFITSREIAPAPGGESSGNILTGVRIPPLRFRRPEIKENLLSSGVRLFSLNDPELPMVTLELQFRGGLDSEPVADAGILDASLELLKIGGAGDKSGEEIARALSSMGVRLSFDSSYEYWSISLTSLRRDFDAAFAVLRDILLKPRLNPEKLEVIKTSLRASLRRRNDRPGNIARRKMREILYPGRRRGYFLKEKNIRRLSVERVRSELKRRLTGAKITAALSGDIENLDVAGRLNGLIAKFPRGRSPLRAESPRPRLYELNERARGNIVLVAHPTVQSVITIGAYLPPHNHRDFFALQMSNYILGGGSFNSRLMREVRVKRGLAYYAYSYNGFFGRDGRFVASSATRVRTTAAALRVMLEVIQGMDEGVSAGELKLARDSILNALVFQFSNPAAILLSELRFRRHNLSPDYMKRFPNKIRSLKKEAVRDVARYRNAKNLFIVVVGPRSLEESLKKIRPVVVIKPDDPPPE